MVNEDTFKALVVDRGESELVATVKELTVADLPEEDVLIQVDYSTLNYKEGLGFANRSKIFRVFPIVPGVDLAGTVVESNSPDFSPGDQVILNGWSVGERYWGGYAQMARIKSDFLIPLPQGIDTWKAMAIGLFYEYQEAKRLTAKRNESELSDQPCNSAGDVWREPLTGMDFIWIPGSSFDMGAGPWDDQSSVDEQPVHEVTLTGFWMAKFPVTVTQYAYFAAEHRGHKPNHAQKAAEHQPYRGKRSAWRLGWSRFRRFPEDILSEVKNH